MFEENAKELTANVRSMGMDLRKAGKWPDKRELDD